MLLFLQKREYISSKKKLNKKSEQCKSSVTPAVVAIGYKDKK